MPSLPPPAAPGGSRLSSDPRDTAAAGTAPASPPPGPPPELPTLRDAFDELTRSALPGVSAGLAALYVAFAIGHPLFLPPPAREIMTAVAAVSGLGVGLFALWLRRHTLPLRASHPASAALAAVALGNSVLHVALTGDAAQVTNFMLIIVGAGSLLMSTAWFVLIAATAGAAWSVLAATVLLPAGAVHGLFALASSTLLGAVLHVVRRRSFTRLHRLRTHDALRQRALEAATAAALSASQSKGQFLANMSHEIRTPLNAVIGMTDLLQGTPLDAEQREYAAVVQASAQALLGVVDDILDFSRMEAGRLHFATLPFSPRAVVDDVAKILRKKAELQGTRLVTEVSADVPGEVVGDAGRLRQVLLNLAGNAVKFTDGGQVTVRCTVASEPPPGPDEVALRFEVEDTGIGISPEARRRLFEPFFQVDATTTRRHGGTGLGLPISRELVQHMGGDIGLTSEPGEGTCFWFTVRLARPTAPPR